ncbi:MAG: hypothetical protein WC606_02995 [Candidatus Absconditabacterales bacterium]
MLYFGNHKQDGQNKTGPKYKINNPPLNSETYDIVDKTRQGSNEITIDYTRYQKRNKLLTANKIEKCRHYHGSPR